MIDLAAVADAAAKLYDTRHGRKWSTPGELANNLDPRNNQTPTLDLIDSELTRLYDTPDGRLILSCPPQIGKSYRCSLYWPLWVLLQAPDTRIAIISYEHNVARRWGRRVRDTIIGHPELGLSIRHDLSAQHEWELSGYEGGVYSAGIGAALTGRPVDLLIIDDPIKGHAQADSEIYREAVWDWWTGTGSTRLGPGAPVLQVATRWHEKDLAGQLLSAEDGHMWREINIPAQADHRPEKGETDPLGRDPGQFLQSTRRNKNGTPMSDLQWERVKIRVGARDWNAMYQGKPSPPEGTILKRSFWKEFKQPMWVDREDGSKITLDTIDGDTELIQSWDLTFKDTAQSDYVCGQIWLRRGHNVYLLDQIWGRYDFVETCRQIRVLTARWPQAILKLVEDKANGPAVISALSRIMPGLVAEEPNGSKESRAWAITPFAEAGNIWLPSPELAPWIEDTIDEFAAFGTGGANDDRVDAMTQAVNRLLLQPILEDNYQQAEEYDEMDIRGFYASPY